MKTKLFTLCVAATLTCSMSFAKVWRVNNNVGVTADFTTAQAANDAPGVSSGDTIHIEPSIVDYGALNCTKRLTWISTGEFLTTNLNQQYSTNAGTINSITAYVVGCANSVFHVSVNGSFSINATGTKVDRCYVSGTLGVANYGYGTPADIVIINSYIRSTLSLSYGNNIVVTNNIFDRSFNVSGNVPLAVITHNVFNAGSAGSSTINNSIVENNIFNKATTAYTFTNCTVQYNMSVTGVLPAGNNNIVADMNNVFINSNGNTDDAFQLRAASPAIGAGSAGVNMGAYGGASPFKLALQPAIPAIYKIQAPAAPAGNTLNVTFSTKSNN